MTTTGLEVPISCIFYRGVRLERVAPKPDAEDRFEAPQFGGHFPMEIWVERRSPKHQWCAAFLPGCVAYSWDPEDALEEARERAIDSLYRQAARLENLGQGDS
jgi:hypothetical protein